MVVEYRLKKTQKILEKSQLISELLKQTVHVQGMMTAAQQPNVTWVIFMHFLQQSPRS